MLDTSLLEKLKSIKDKYYISRIEKRNYDNSLILYIPIDRISEIAKDGCISKLQLEILLKNLSSEYENKIEILYTESDRLNSLAKGIELLLKANFSDLINETNFTFLSSEKVSVEIFIENLNEDKKNSINKYIESLFKESHIEVVNIEWIGDPEEYPSPIEILIALKKMQPISLELFLTDLNLDFQSINTKWLNRQLDKLIKRGLLVRDNVSKQYALSWKGLSIIPNVSNSSNSDIKRALSLGHRKW